MQKRVLCIFALLLVLHTDQCDGANVEPLITDLDTYLKSSGIKLLRETDPAVDAFLKKKVAEWYPGFKSWELYKQKDTQMDDWYAVKELALVAIPSSAVYTIDQFLKGEMPFIMLGIILGTLNHEVRHLWSRSQGTPPSTFIKSKKEKSIYHKLRTQFPLRKQEEKDADEIVSEPIALKAMAALFDKWHRKSPHLDPGDPHPPDIARKKRFYERSTKLQKAKSLWESKSFIPAHIKSYSDPTFEQKALRDAELITELKIIQQEIASRINAVLSAQQNLSTLENEPYTVFIHAVNALIDTLMRAQKGEEGGLIDNDALKEKLNILIDNIRNAQERINVDEKEEQSDFEEAVEVLLQFIEGAIIEMSPEIPLPLQQEDAPVTLPYIKGTSPAKAAQILGLDTDHYPSLAAYDYPEKVILALANGESSIELPYFTAIQSERIRLTVESELQKRKEEDTTSVLKGKPGLLPAKLYAPVVISIHEIVGEDIKLDKNALEKYKEIALFIDSLVWRYDTHIETTYQHFIHILLHTTANIIDTVSPAEATVLKILSERLDNRFLIPIFNTILKDYFSNATLNLSSMNIQSLGDLFAGEILNYNKGIIHKKPHLRKVNLSHNRIKKIKKNEFFGLPNLLELDLSHNAIESIDMHSFITILSLQKLNLSYNKITTLGIGIFSGLSHLLELDLSHNSIRSIHQSVFTSLQHLEKVNFSYNLIRSIHSDTFKNNTNLKIVNTTNNPLDSVVPISPSSAKKAKI